MLGRNISPQDAVNLGLATEVASGGKLMEAALGLAGKLASFAPLAIGMAKLILNTCSDVDAETGRRLERLGQSVLKTTQDHKEAAAAFLEKRNPAWQGR